MQIYDDEENPSRSAAVDAPDLLDQELAGATPTLSPTQEESKFHENLQNAGKVGRKADKFYVKEKTGWGSMSRQAKLAIIGVVTSVVGVIIVASLFLSGPLLFVHIAQLLKQFHFGGVNSHVDNRTARIYRHYKWQDKPENRRLSLLANNLANRIDAQYAKAGMELDFDNRGKLRSIRIDTSKYPADEIKKIGQDFAVQPEANNRFVNVIVPDNFSAYESRALFDRTRRPVGLAGFGGFVQSRLPAARIGPSVFHPIKKLDERILESARDAREKWRERKNNIIQTGDADGVRIRGSPGAPGEDGRPTPSDSEGVANAVEDVSDSGGADDIKNTLNERVGRGLAIAGAADLVTGLVCLVHTMAELSDDIEYANVVVPSMRIGGYYLGLGSQIMTGQDLQSQQLGFESERIYDKSDDNNPETKPSSFFDAESIRQNLGQTGGTPAPNASRLGGANNLLSELNQKIDPGAGWAIRTGCGIVNSPVGELITFGIDLAVAPASAFVGLGASFLLSTLLDDAARWLAGEEISTEVAGAALGAIADQGSFFMSNAQYITLGATVLSDQERAEHQEIIEAEQRYYAGQRHWSERYLSPSNANSLVSITLRNSPRDTGQVVAGLLNNRRAFVSVFGLLNKKASAASTNFDYGVPKFAYRPDELVKTSTDPSLENPFESAKPISDLIPEMHQSFGEKCFGLKFDADEHFQLVDLVNQKKLAEHPDYADCRRQDEEFLRYREYIGNLLTLVSLDCYLGNTDACKEIGFADQINHTTSSVSSGAKGEDTSGQNCTLGEDAGLGPTPDPDTKIRLCRIEGITVNVSIEQNLKAVLDGGRGAGLSFGGSSYRSYETQIRLRREYCGTSHYAIYEKPSGECTPPTARPGNSMHEWGLAVDFTCSGTLIRSRGSDCFGWLEDNQAIHKLKNLPSEPWHWSTTGN